VKQGKRFSPGTQLREAPAGTIPKSEFLELKEQVLEYAFEFHKQLCPDGYRSKNGCDWVVPRLGIRISLKTGAWFAQKGAFKDEFGNVIRTPQGDPLRLWIAVKYPPETLDDNFVCHDRKILKGAMAEIRDWYERAKSGEFDRQLHAPSARRCRTEIWIP
jgi:hypothetical protein